MAEKSRQYYKNSKKWREHEVQMALLKAFAADPELKYYLGVAGGAGVGVLGSLIGKVDGGSSSSAGDVAGSAALGWLALGPAGALIMAAWDTESKQNPLGSVVSLAGTSFAGFCAAVLLLKAMSGGEDGAGILGKIVGAAI